MTASLEMDDGVTSERILLGDACCPACGGLVLPGAARCLGCAFTGEDSMRMFTESPPPLLPVLDVAGIFTDDGLRRIEAARTKVRGGRQPKPRGPFHFPDHGWQPRLGAPHAGGNHTVHKLDAER